MPMQATCKIFTFALSSSSTSRDTGTGNNLCLIPYALLVFILFLENGSVRICFHLQCDRDYKNPQNPPQKTINFSIERRLKPVIFCTLQFFEDRTLKWDRTALASNLRSHQWRKPDARQPSHALNNLRGRKKYDLFSVTVLQTASCASRQNIRGQDPSISCQSHLVPRRYDLSRRTGSALLSCCRHSSFLLLARR
jgi:hypothetical protein